MQKIWVVGIGPGNRSDMTERAYLAMQSAEVLCAYTAYIELVRELFPDKTILSSGMTREVERCRLALDTAIKGQSVALLSSGDAGVYGMAGLLLQLAEEYPPVEIEVVAGVSAAMSGAALLGAPLGHDFAVISLSDLLTPWELIEKRLRAAAEGDFAICIYNPSSKRRSGYLYRACAILLEQKSAETACAWVRNVGRSGESCGIMNLAALKDFEADMFTTIFIGNSDSKVISGRLVTPRGYEARL